MNSLGGIPSVRWARGLSLPSEMVGAVGYYLNLPTMQQKVSPLAGFKDEKAELVRCWKILSYMFVSQDLGMPCTHF